MRSGLSLTAVEADLCIVGGGYTGLWAALHAKRDDPQCAVALVQAERCGEAASGRKRPRGVG